MRVLDLFSGLGGWSAAFRERLHAVTTIDLDYRFNPTYCRDIGSLENLGQFGRFDVVLASPPCEKFSVASISRYWDDGKPKSVRVQEAIELVKHTLKLIEGANPSFWILENPRGMLRNVIGKPEATVTYCQYGLEFMKPTDLWGKLPQSFIPKSCKPKDSCHLPAPRGYDAKKQIGSAGIQAITKKDFKDSHRFAYAQRDAAYRALIPYGLSLEMCLACERDMDSEHVRG